MTTNHRILFVTTLFLLTVSVTYAAGLVPCGGPSEPMCRACDFVSMGQKIMDWFILTAAAFIALMFAIGGMKMVMSAGNSGKVSEGKEMMTNAIIGFLVLLGAWLIVNTILMMVMSDGKGIESWGTIQCVDNPAMSSSMQNNQGGVSTNTGGVTTTGGTALSTAQITQKYGTQINTYCSGSAMTNCKDVVAALIAAESKGKTSVTSGAGAVGLMQLMPSNGGLNCDQNDTACIDSQIQKGIKMIEGAYASTKSIPLTLASYNGGGAAIAPSGCCPSGYAYQCQYDCGGSKTYKQCTALSNVCTANTGFVETRNYVNDICKTIGGCN